MEALTCALTVSFAGILLTYAGSYERRAMRGGSNQFTIYDAVRAWAGLFSPLSDSSASVERVRRAFATSKETSQLCFSVPRGDACPADACEQKQSGRCVPSRSAAIDPRVGETAMNNSLDFEAYEHIRSIDYENLTTEEPQVCNVFVCWENGVFIAIFPAGSTQNAEDVREVAEGLARKLGIVWAKLAREHDVSCLRAFVLAGHSEGGAVAEATMCAILKGADKQRIPRHMLYLTTSGAHMWASPDERDLLADQVQDRYVSFLAASADFGTMDTYCAWPDISLDTGRSLRKTLGSLGVVVMEKTMLIQKGADSAVGHEGLAELDTLERLGESHRTQSGLTLKWSLRDQVKRLHDWSTYERLIGEWVRQDALGSHTIDFEDADSDD